MNKKPSPPLAAALFALAGLCVHTEATPPDTFSPVVSFQYLDSLDEPGSNTVVTSPVVSYQYYDWAGDDVLALKNSAIASYLYLVAPQIIALNPNPVSGSNGHQNFVIQGANFDPACTVTLRDLTTGEPPFYNRTKIEQSGAGTSITINPIFGTSPSTWSVEVINPGTMSSGQVTFGVVAPTAAPKITGVGVGTLASATFIQTIGVNGSNIAPGSQFELRSLDSNFSTVLSATVVNSGLALFDFLFDRVGTWTVKLITPNGEPTQPLQFTANSPGFRLSFPLKEGGRFGGGTPFNTRISSVLDHQIGPGITTFDGERFTIAHPNVPNPPKDSDYRHPLGHPVLQGVANYDSTDIASYNDHHGYDYLGHVGSDGNGGVDNVYAAGPGAIELIYDDGGDSGNYVRITHDDTGYKTFYFHLHSFASGFTPGKSGQTVREGEFIGKVGTTGASSGPHLHFEVRSKKTDQTFVAVDPYSWLPNSGTDSTDPAPVPITSPLWRNQEYPTVDASPQSFPAVPAGGGVLAVSIHAGPQTHQATVSDGTSWLSILSGQTGTGDATLTLAASTNIGPARIGRVTVAIPIGGPIEIRVMQAAGVPGQNPSPTEVAAQMKALAKQYQIPTPILAAIAWRNTAWQQFNTSQQPFSWPSGEVGMMRVNPANPLLPAGTDPTRLGQEWFYNLEMGCHILRAYWKGRPNILLSAWADLLDNDPRVIENWFIPVGRFYGGGSPGYTAAGQVWDTIKSLPFPAADFFAPIPDVGDPRSLTGFPTSIANALHVPNLPLAEVSNLIVEGLYTLKILRRQEAALHRWNWDANSVSPPLAPSSFGKGFAAAPPPNTPEIAVDITESIGIEPSQITFDQWAVALGGEEAFERISDNDSDGLVNLIEFALGGDPNEPSSMPGPSVSRNGSNLEMVAKVPKNTTGVLLDVESSTDCLLWTSAGVTPTVLSEDTVSQTLKWIVPASWPTQFVRFRVTAP